MGAITLLQGGESRLSIHFCQEKLVKNAKLFINLTNPIKYQGQFQQESCDLFALLILNTTPYHGFFPYHQLGVGILHYCIDDIIQQLASLSTRVTSFQSQQHQSSLLQVSSITRVTSVKSLEGILTYQSHTSKVSRRHLHSPESHQSSLLLVSSLTRVT